MEASQSSEAPSRFTRSVNFLDVYEPVQQFAQREEREFSNAVRYLLRRGLELIAKEQEFRNQAQG